MSNLKKNLIILVLISLIVIFFSLKDNFFDVIDYLVNINLFWLVITLIIIFIYFLCQTFSLYIHIKKIKPTYKISNAFSLYFIGLFFSGITPFSTGGQPFQMYILKKEDIRVSDSGNILLQNFLAFQIDLILIGAFSIITNYKFHILPSENLLKKTVLLGFFINCVVLLVLFTFSFAKKMNSNLFNKIINLIFKLKFIKNKEEKKEKLNETLNNFYSGAVNIKRNKKNFLLSLIFNAVSLFCLYTIPLFLFYSLGDYESLNISKSIMLSGYTYLIGSFVPIPGGSGGLEYSFVDFFKTIRDGGFLSAILLLWRFITYYLGIILGSISLFLYKKESD